VKKQLSPPNEKGSSNGKSVKFKLKNNYIMDNKMIIASMIDKRK
jgi:hypothetical protein